MYSGRVQIVNYETQQPVKTIEVSDLPVRAGKFVARKNWIVVGSDDFHVRVFNYNTGEKVKQFEAHPDYIRVMDVHPSLPCVLTAGDDMSIKLWNWEEDWRNVRTFEGHGHYVMSVAFNPKDPNTFASVSLDRTVKIWNLSSNVPNFTLETNENKGLNFVDYYPQSDKPYLITASDDRTIKVWDYHSKSCVATLEGHTHNVSFAVFHPELPIIISGAEDASVKIWNSNTYKMEQTLNYGLERAWCVGTRKGSNMIALGFDTGTVALQMGKEEPAISMDPNGRLIWSKHSEVFSHAIKGNEDNEDGELLPLSGKELGNIEIYPTQLQHSPNGRFVAVCGDGEYIIYTALAWRNKAFGSAMEFAWAQDSNEYAILENNGSIRAFKNFQERPLGHIKSSFNGQQIFGGVLLGIKGDDFVAFFDWSSGELVKHIDGIDAKQVLWNDAGDMMAIVTEDSFYTLRYNSDNFNNKLNEGTLGEEEDDEENEPIVVDQSIEDSVRTGKWVGACFVFTTYSNRLNYLVGGEVYTISHFDKQMYLLGYLPRDNSIYLSDKDVNVTSYRLSLAVINFQTIVLQGESELFDEYLEKIPENELGKVARFLETQEYPEIALKVSKDPEHQFDLAIQLGKLDQAGEIAEKVGNDHKWKQLGDAALENWNVVLAQQSFEKANDLDSLLLIYTSTGNKSALKQLSTKAVEAGKYNLAFQVQWYLGDVDGCIDLLKKTGRASEAAIMALTYGGDVQSCVGKWKESLNRDGRGKVANTIADPESCKEMFPSNVGQKVVKKAEVQQDLIDVDDEDEDEEMVDAVEEEVVDPTAAAAAAAEQEVVEEVNGEVAKE